jgi:hypothetical protein
MLKRLFTSNTRIKLLTLFLANPDEEYFIRELTRKLDEQINSVRRELDNLKKLGLLRAKTKNRKKFYIVNKNFILFNELKSIILKAISDKENIAKKITHFGDIDVIVLSGVFVEKDTPIDLLLVGNVDRKRLEDFFTNELETKKPVKFSIMSKEEFLYRRKCSDQFLHNIFSDPDNIIALNKLEKED